MSYADLIVSEYVEGTPRNSLTPTEKATTGTSVAFRPWLPSSL